MGTMTAAVIQQAGGEFMLEQRPLPEPAAGQVRIRVQACGMCHSDDVVKQGTMPGLTLPRVPGHEVAGVIDALGEDVSHWQTGDRVGVGWHGGHCFQCGPCREGDFVTCENKRICGVAYDGGYQEYMVAPVEALARIPDELDHLAAAPLLCAGVTTFGALRESGARPGDLVAIQGIGGLGHLALQYASRMGFKTVAISRGESKRALAMQLGAHDYIDSAVDDPGQALLARGGARAIMVTAPDPAAVEPLAEGLGRNGRMLLVAVMHQPVSVNSRLLLRKRAALQGWPAGSAAESEDCMVFSGDQSIAPQVESYPLARINEAWEQMINNRARFRVVIDMG